MYVNMIMYACTYYTNLYMHVYRYPYLGSGKMLEKIEAVSVQNGVQCVLGPLRLGHSSRASVFVLASSSFFSRAISAVLNLLYTLFLPLYMCIRMHIYTEK